MNIFWFCLLPEKNAQMHCDKHVVKMPVELAQMLSTAHWIHDSTLVRHVYKPAYVRHPCTLWVASSADSYYETLQLFKALLAEYSFRYKKEHKCGRLLRFLEVNPCAVTKSKPKPQAVPSKYFSTNAVTAYRNYFNGDKQHIAKWTGRPVPFWYKEV